MFFSNTSEYALRIMAFIAINQDQGRMNSSTIAKGTNMPSHYCSKILRKLVNAKILTAERGKSGGFILSKDPTQIKFREIFESVDFELDPKHCVFGLKKCNSSKPCMLHYRWQSFKEVFRDWAENNSLADVIEDRVSTIAQLQRNSNESNLLLKISESSLKSRLK